MDDKLSIKRENHAELVVLVVSGRLDGYWSKVLDDSLDELLQSGVLHVGLDLSEVYYLSSLGIRVLVKYARQYRQVQGSFGVKSFSEAVGEVLSMAGLQQVLGFQNVVKSASVTRKDQLHETECYTYSINRISDRANMVYQCLGDPEKLRTGGYSATDCQTLMFNPNRFGLGLGAIGAHYEDFKTRFGEFAAFGDAVVYAPAGRVGSPDYMIRSGNLIPKIELLYGILLDGEFSQEIRFTPKDIAHSLPFTALLSDVERITGFDSFAMVMLAESAGIVGLSLNNQDITTQEDSKNLFGFPQVRESMMFTTEPAYANHITLTIGIVCSPDDPVLNRFTRPLNGNAEKNSHFHTAIFNHHPIKTAQLSLQETLSRLFNTAHLQGVLHLIQDNRPLTGVGESEFKNGICWIGRITS